MTTLIRFEAITFEVAPPTYDEKKRYMYYEIERALMNETAGSFWLLNRKIGWFGPRDVVIEHGEIHKRISRLRPRYQIWLFKSLYDLVRREKPNRLELNVPWGQNVRRTIIVVYRDKQLRLDLKALPTV